MGPYIIRTYSNNGSRPGLPFSKIRYPTSSRCTTLRIPHLRHATALVRGTPIPQSGTKFGVRHEACGGKRVAPSCTWLDRYDLGQFVFNAHGAIQVYFSGCILALVLQLRFFKMAHLLHIHLYVLYMLCTDSPEFAATRTPFWNEHWTDANWPECQISTQNLLSYIQYRRTPFWKIAALWHLGLQKCKTS